MAAAVLAFLSANFLSGPCNPSSCHKEPRVRLSLQNHAANHLNYAEPLSGAKSRHPNANSSPNPPLIALHHLGPPPAWSSSRSSTAAEPSVCFTLVPGRSGRTHIHGRSRNDRRVLSVSYSRPSVLNHTLSVFCFFLLLRSWIASRLATVFGGASLKSEHPCNTATYR